MIVLYIFLGILILALPLISFLIKQLKIENIKKEAESFKKLEVIYNVSDFFKLYEKIKKANIGIHNIDDSGIYVIRNLKKQMYYVGQSKNVFKRVNQHFTGKGNGDVYADYKYGDIFEISIIKCPIEKLNTTEKYYIEKYNAFKSGYNKNAGCKSYI